MNQFKNSLQLIKYRSIYITITILLIFLSINHMEWRFILLVFVYFIYKKHRNISLILLIFGVVYLTRYFLIVNNPIIDGAQHTVKVTKVSNKDNLMSLYGNCNNERVKVVLSGGESVFEGDTIIIRGNFEQISSQSIPGNFDYRNYLLSKNISNTIYTEQYEIKESNSNIVYTVKSKLKTHINDNIPLSKSYVLTFVMADKSQFDQDTIEGISILGISHLFALSGMHIALLVFTLRWLLVNTINSTRVVDITIYTFLFAFMFITSFAASVVRSALMYIVSRLKDMFSWDISTLDVISIVFIVLILLRPLYFYDAGFSLSFLVVYIIVLFKDNLTDHHRVNQLFVIGLLSMIITLPITFRFSYNVNLLSLLFNVLFLYIIMLFIMPLSYILLFFPSLDLHLHEIFKLFEQIMKWSKLVNIFSFSVSFKNQLTVIIYYKSLYIAAISKKYSRKLLFFVPFLICILIITNPRYFDFSDKIAFLDVNGDSIVLLDNNNRCNMVIDTGENDDFDGLINYLKYHGLTSFDHIFITHYHADHYGEVQELYNNFHVKNLWFNDSHDLPDTGFYCGDFFVQIFPNNKLWSNENNNSMVIYISINNDHYLFTGDIEKERESEIIENYIFPVDYLKVAHHGSDTSSTADFIEHFSPKEAIIIAKEGNKYKHPHHEVISLLEENDVVIHRTDLHGTITFEYKFKKLYKKHSRE